MQRIMTISLNSGSLTTFKQLSKIGIKDQRPIPPPRGNSTYRYLKNMHKNEGVNMLTPSFLEAFNH